MPRRRTGRAVPTIAVYTVPGRHRVNVTSPSKHDYSIESRVPFEIAPEDQTWFFEEWDEQKRAFLVRLEDHVPTQGYSDPRNPYVPHAAASREEEEDIVEAMTEEAIVAEPVPEDVPPVFGLTKVPDDTDAPTGEPESEE